MTGNEPGAVHVFQVRVYYEDTDAGGIVYYANYLKFAERARTEMLRGLGIDTTGLIDGEGVAFTVRHCTADFRKPARLDDWLEVHTRLLEVGGASLIAEQRIMRDGEELVGLRLRLACIDRSQRPARLPTGVRASLEDMCAGKQRN